MPLVLWKADLMVVQWRWWVIFGVAAWLLHGGTVQATTFTWTGARDGDWSTVFLVQTNWSGNVVPTSSGSNELVLSSSATTTTVNNDIASPFLLNKLTFGGSAFSSNGGTLEFASNGAIAPPIAVNSAST